MASQDKWYVNKEGVDIMDVIVADALTYPEGRALKCIIKGDTANAEVYIDMMKTIREGRLAAIDELTRGFDMTDAQMDLVRQWKELI